MPLNKSLIKRIEEVRRSGKPGSVTIHHDAKWDEIVVEVRTKETIKSVKHKSGG